MGGQCGGSTNYTRRSSCRLDTGRCCRRTAVCLQLYFREPGLLDGRGFSTAAVGTANMHYRR